MEGWVKIGVQRASVLYPNSCYNEPCYIEVQVYFVQYHFNYATSMWYSSLSKEGHKLLAIKYGS